MRTNVERAREIAMGIQTGLVWVDADKADEVADLLESMATVIETLDTCAIRIEFALKYYSEPDLYCVGVALDDVILDGGLRARTALGLLKQAAVSRPVHRTRAD
jgi:hypothetical protein